MATERVESAKKAAPVHPDPKRPRSPPGRHPIATRLYDCFDQLKRSQMVSGPHKVICGRNDHESASNRSQMFTGEQRWCDRSVLSPERRKVVGRGMRKVLRAVLR
jgi:hypothetical protein